MKLRNFWGALRARCRSSARRRKRTQRFAYALPTELLEARCLLSGAAPAGPAPPYDVVLVTNDGSLDPLVGFLNANFMNLASVTPGAFTDADTNAATRAAVSAADLVVVSRSTSSTSYDDSHDEVDFWNGLSQPILLLNGYVARDSRWNWIDSDLISGPTADSETTILNATDSLFAGVDVHLGQADLFQSGRTVEYIQANVTAAGGGTVLGTGLNSAGNPLIGVARFCAGADLVLGFRGTRTTHGGDRVLFASARPSSLTTDGQRVLANAVSEFLPQSVVPTATPDDYAVWAGVPWSETAATGVLANDVAPGLIPLTAALNSGPANGSLTWNANGSFTYRPNPGFDGTDMFTYHASNGRQRSDVATVTINVRPNPAELMVTIKEVASGRALNTVDLAIDQNPYVDGEMDDRVSRFSDALAGGKLLQTGEDDRNFAGESHDSHSHTHADDEAYVRFHANQNVTVYVGYHTGLVELPDWLGQSHGWRASAEVLRSYDDDYFVLAQTFEAGDVALGFNPAHAGAFAPDMYIVAIKPLGAAPINNAPYAAGDVYDLAGGASLNVVAAGGVLANDLDSEGNALSATLTRPPLFGTATLAADGSFTYSPGPSFTRWDSFQYQVHDGQAAGNATLVTIVNGQPLDPPSAPHPDDAVKRHEHVGLFELVPRHAATHTAVPAGGLWSARTTWENGIVPVDHANVLIPAGTTVTVDADIAATLRTVRVDGTLRFAPSVSTTLRADTVIVDPAGTFEMGTAAAPIATNVTSQLIIADRGPIDRVWDPHALSRGLVSHGTTSMYGTAATSFLPLAQGARAGDTQLVLDGVPANWKVGDRIVIAGTSDEAASRNESEPLTIRNIQGSVVTVDALRHNHLAPAAGLQVHVAHLTRNAVIESQNPSIATRGHVMFMHKDAVEIHNAGFYQIGRTDKKVRANDAIVVHDGVQVPGRGTNPRGRYGVHFHRNGATNDGSPARVDGSVVWDSLGWGYVNHSSFVEFSDNVAYDVDGAGFVSEAGDEIGSFQRNISLHNIGSGQGLESRGDIQDFGHQGDGFWFQGGGLRVTDNVAAASRQQGFIFFTRGLEQPGLGTTRFLTANLPVPSIAGTNSTIAVGSVPLFDVHGNTTYGSREGLHTQYHLLSPGHAVRSLIADFTAWNIGDGIDSPYTKQTDIVNARLINDVLDPGSNGFDSNGVTENIRFYNVTIIGFSDGIEVPRRGANLLDGGVLHNRVNIEMDLLREEPRSMTITGNVEFRLLPPFAGERFHVLMRQPFTPHDGSFEHVFLPDALFIVDAGGTTHQVWHHEQAPGFVPFPAAQVGLPPEYVGLTNQQLWDGFGKSVGGQVAPADAFTVLHIHGLLTSTPAGFNVAPTVDSATFSVTESAAIGVGVGTVTARDEDADPLTFSIVAGNDGGAFAIDPRGRITVAGRLDYETQPRYDLVVEASDGSGIGSATVTVEIRDAFDGIDPTGLVMRLAFDEALGLQAVDASGRGNHGTLKNGAAFNGNGAALLDGLNDLVDVADSVDINRGIHGQRTINVRFQVADASLATRKQVLYEEGDSKRGLSIYVFGGKVYVGGWDTRSTPRWTGTFLSAAVSSGAWHEATLVLDGTTALRPNALKGYLDGTPFGSGAGLQLGDHPDDIGIGRVDGSTLTHTGKLGNSNSGLRGSIGEVRVYNRVLSDSEIAWLSRDLRPVNLVYEAEQAAVVGALIASGNSGYSGTGYVDYHNSRDDSIEWTIDVPRAGDYTLQFRYAFGSSNRPLELFVDNTSAGLIDWPTTGGWSVWRTYDVHLPLTEGTHTVKLVAVGMSGPNIDHVRLIG